MKKLNEKYLEEKKSKFISVLYEINDICEVDSIINELKNEKKENNCRICNCNYSIHNN